MKKILASLLIVFVLNPIFSQKIEIYDFNQGPYEMETMYLPDTLYVIHGKIIEIQDYLYVDNLDEFDTENSDIILIEKPSFKMVYSENEEDFVLRSDLKFNRIINRNIYLSGNLDITIYNKKVKIIPFSKDGKQISEKEYFDKKFSISSMVKELLQK